VIHDLTIGYMDPEAIRQRKAIALKPLVWIMNMDDRLSRDSVSAF
jgi:hypothetical protein